jgi:hypothetical protein
MQKHEKATDYLSTVTPRLIANGFKITEDIVYKGQPFKYAAKRTKFQFEFSSFVQSFFIFAEFSDIDRTSFKEFTSKSFSYSKSFRRIPVPFVLYGLVICFPVAIVENVDTAVAKAFRSEGPPKHWTAFEMPVICDLRAKQLYYPERTPSWGSLYWDLLRKTARTVLSP